MSDERKDLPPVNSPNFDERLREAIQTYLGNRGDKLDRGLTLRDLTEANIIKLRAGYLAGGGKRPVAGAGPAVTDAYEIDLTPPPTPTGFAVSAAISHIFIECADPTYPQGHGHARTVVYGATWTAGALPTFSDAVEITTFQGTIFAHPTNPATIWRLWIKWQTVDGVLSASPAGGTNGLVAETGQDVTKLVEAMTGPGNPFTVLAVDTVIDGVTFPAATYSTKAFIIDEQVTNSKIKNLAVDDAKIASLGVSKLTAGSISVGAFIQSPNYVSGTSGWHIHGNGAAEFSAVTVRGTVYANAGWIGGNTIDLTGLQSPGYSPGVSGWRLNSDGTFSANSIALRGQITGGAFTTAAWPAAGAGNGFYLGPSGLFLGNFNDGQFLQVDPNGRIRAPGLDINGGVATFSGALFAASGSFAGNLDAADGTFSGSLTADAVNAVNTINLAGNSVTVSNAAAGASTAACSVYVPAGQVMRIIALCQSGPITIDSAEKVYLGVSGTFNGVAFSRTSFTAQTTGVGNIQTNDATTYVGYAEVTGPATVSVTANGTDVTCALFGGMK